MSASRNVSIVFKAPDVSQADIESFHAAHFSTSAVDLFARQFLYPVQSANEGVDNDYDYGEEEEDDGLGYYPDGVKRTLTDEQIAIFRHSEVEALRRAEAKALKQDSQENTKSTKSNSNPIISDAIDFSPGNGKSVDTVDAMDETGYASEDGEIETEKPVLTKAEMKRVKRQRARQRKKESQKFQPEKKPDLRKRTWDVVEAGMDSLDYDDLAMSKGSRSASSAQRKQISYDD